MEGIDIYSKFQTVTSWQQVRAADIGWCYQKVSDGTTTRTVQSPVAGHAAGVLQGGYHFSQPGSPVVQANLLVDRCTANKMLDLRPALDLEDNPPGSSLPNIPDSQKADWAIAFGRQVKARGHGFTLYANDSTWSLVKAKLKTALPDTFRWVARYRTAPPDNPWDAWQYTSSGSVPGIAAGSVDRSKGLVPHNQGVDVLLTTEDLNAIQARIEAVVPGLVRFKVLATGHDPANPNANTDTVWTFGGRNIVDIIAQTLINQEAFITAINSLRDLIIADDANDVTAQQVADALQGIIVANVVPAVTSAVQEATSDLEVTVDAHAIAVAAAEEIHNRLAG